MRAFFKKYGVFLAWLIALLSTLISLYCSEILHWAVCPLCWYQRMAVYPLVILLGMAAYHDDKSIIPYAKVFCIIGFLFAGYQYAEQMIPGFSPIDLCTQGVACNMSEIKWLGFITLPLLDMLACAAMYLLLCC